MNPAFWLYAMECEGELDTHQSKLNQVVSCLKNCPNPMDPDIQHQAIYQAGLTPSDLRPQDIEYIERQVFGC